MHIVLIFWTFHLALTICRVVSPLGCGAAERARPWLPPSGAVAAHAALTADG
jgi:hypothetical protein